MNSTSNETQTASEDKSSKSAWYRFCLRRGINPNLVMLKMTLFVMHGGKLENDSMKNVLNIILEAFLKISFNSNHSLHCNKNFEHGRVECHSQWSNYEIRRHRVCSTYFWNVWLENASNLTVVYLSAVIYKRTFFSSHLITFTLSHDPYAIHRNNRRGDCNNISRPAVYDFSSAANNRYVLIYSVAKFSHCSWTKLCKSCLACTSLTSKVSSKY